MYTVRIPVLGFENDNNMSIIRSDENFATLQMSEEANMHLISSKAIEDFEFDIDENFAKELELEKETNFSIYFSIVVNNPISNSVVNLTAPIIVNEDKKLLGQYIINQPHEKAVFLTMGEINTL